MDRPADVIAVERRHVQRLRQDSLPRKRRIAMHHQRQHLLLTLQAVAGAGDERIGL